MRISKGFSNIALGLGILIVTFLNLTDCDIVTDVPKTKEVYIYQRDSPKDIPEPELLPVLHGNDTRCRISEYLCSNKKCIPINRFCDGSNDCGDSSDEPRHCTLACWLLTLLTSVQLFSPEPLQPSQSTTSSPLYYNWQKLRAHMKIASLANTPDSEQKYGNLPIKILLSKLQKESNSGTIVEIKRPDNSYQQDFMRTVVPRKCCKKRCSDMITFYRQGN